MDRRLPPTTDGPFAAIANDIQRGAQLAMDELNTAGGVLGQLFEKERVQFVVGGLATHGQMAINEQTKKAGVLYISVQESDEDQRQARHQPPDPSSPPTRSWTARAPRRGTCNYRLRSTRGSRTSRSQSPTTLMPSTTPRMARPGKSASHQPVVR
jgi:hypothetical protein